MKNKNLLKEQSILFLLSQNNFIVPEIQREYVWGNNEEVLKRFLDSLFNKKGIECTECGCANTNEKVNIGFLYTYKPSYVNFDNERFLDENLIDGQQRFTTVFLLLFYCSLKEGRKAEFCDIIRFDEKVAMAFDYKVRNLTHRFLLELVERSNAISDVKLLLNSKLTWFLDDYKQDPSIQSVIKALRVIHNKLNNSSIRYLDYLLNNVKFYHFRTEATNQGEELYITMNARGEALSVNEENKAALMVEPQQMHQYGKEWEAWQDFFWRGRNKNNPSANADKGFNEFLRWIQVIEMTLAAKVDTNEDDSIQSGSLTDKIVKLIQGKDIKLDKSYFPLDVISGYYKALAYIFESYRNHLEEIRETYPETKIDLLPKTLLHPSQGIIEQSETFLLLPALYYCKKILERGDEVDTLKLFALVRFLSNIKGDITIRKTINKQVINAIKMVDNLLEVSTDIADVIDLGSANVSKSIITPEERFKFKIFRASQSRSEAERAFWRAEDNSICKGKIGHLIQASFFDSTTIMDFKFNKGYNGYDESKFNLAEFETLFSCFEKITEKKSDISGKIWSVLLLSDYYTIYSLNDNHKTIVCNGSDNEDVIIDKHFLSHLYSVRNFNNASEYFNSFDIKFFERYCSKDEVISELDFRKQVYIYYKALSAIGSDYWHWGKGKNFGIYLDQNLDGFFLTGAKFQHFRKRWQGADYNYFDQSKTIVDNFIDNILTS